jgi:hypothetical protein
LFLTENLTRTLLEVIGGVDSLSSDQWHYAADTTSWTIAYIVEHLITHDELFYREVTVLTNLPTMSPQADSLFSDDELILSYREITPQNIGAAPDYLEPLGRWCSKADAIMAYKRGRIALVQFIEQSDKDLRRYYTTSGRGPTKYRDLHQLMLISIAHTERHVKQIRNIQEIASFPK